MDAARLIVATRHALDRARDVRDLIAEAWQAQALAEAVGGHIALHGDPALRPAALSLCEAGGRACGMLQRTGGARAAPLRAARLSGVRDPRAVLRGLLGILGEVVVALVAAVCATEDEELYWQCIDAVDAADDSKDRVCALLCVWEGLRPGGDSG
ncbi:DUF6099 family protein [Streptomyces sp. RB6PN25]|uniref:DUF6099 family protein n=1 Tax=Streptomyces humicola TaxID=2953240 RepID=A0ABT1PZD6_9ACTN|nr:DUF6099 family protein [Streptomyces humicola]MCQ4083038.1 DUF6099 family protein [Streptomyces humicola]